MAQTSINDSIQLLRCLPIFAAALLPLLLLLQPTTTTPTDRGFTVELIHRYSERSPFYDGNLTQSQLLQRLVELSRSRLQWLESTTLGASITAIRPLLEVDRLLYLVPVRIGTGQGRRPYYLLFDTGSSLTWTQCEPCEPCFDQRTQRFNPGHSPTYRPLPQTDRLCDEPDENGHCTFDLLYLDGSSAHGILSQDTFAFHSDGRGHHEDIEGVVFGCAHSATVNVPWNRVDGIIGMGIQPVSLLSQLRHITDRQFSYCLVPPGTGSSGYLRFGRNQVHPRGHLKQTPIVFSEDHGHYYLRLEGISINDRRLNLPPATFAIQASNHGGGCIIDTGTQTSALINPAYYEVSKVLRGHFQHLVRVDEKAKGLHNLELCYETPSNHASVWPHMTLHFQGADYHIENDKLFIVDGEERYFCWMMLRSDRLTILGVLQQYNMRFLYDIQSRMLSFGPENCAAESHH